MLKSHVNIELKAVLLTGIYLPIKRIASIFVSFVVEVGGKYSVGVSDKLKKNLNQV